MTPSTWRRCAGLVASPSPGVVTQALAVGRPCYLVCPTGHLEQKFNQDYYFKYFAGVTNAAASTRAKVRLDGLISEIARDRTSHVDAVAASLAVAVGARRG